MQESSTDQPSPDAPLELRDMSETGESSREYVHDACGGTSTVISDSHFYWLVNPLRFVDGSICVQCGVVILSNLRWMDTGETLAQFRSRMWRRTPLWMKFVQFIAVPVVVGLVAATLVAAMIPDSPHVPPIAEKLFLFAVGYVLAILLVRNSPLGGVIPKLAGLTYHKYR